MIEIVIISVFVLGYLGIAFEHSLKIDKLIPALVMMAIMWGLISYFDLTVFEIDTKNKVLMPDKLKYVLNYFLGHTAEILVFLIGAMTIVETVDFFNGFTFNFLRTFFTLKFLQFFFSNSSQTTPVIFDFPKGTIT